MDRIELLKGDITKLQVDVIVNAANSSLMGGGGVDGAIHRAGGNKILEECKEYVSKHGRLPTGEAMITTGGNLASKFVIHTVGPVWNGGGNNEEKLLTNAYSNSLQLVVENNLHSVAFPNISTGVYHFPKERAAAIAVETVSSFLQKNASLEKVILVCFDEENYKIYESLLK